MVGAQKWLKWTQAPGHHKEDNWFAGKTISKYILHLGRKKLSLSSFKCLQKKEKKEKLSLHHEKYQSQKAKQTIGLQFITVWREQQLEGVFTVLRDGNGRNDEIVIEVFLQWRRRHCSQRLGSDKDFSFVELPSQTFNSWCGLWAEWDSRLSETEELGKWCWAASSSLWRTQETSGRMTSLHSPLYRHANRLLLLLLPWWWCGLFPTSTPYPDHPPAPLLDETSYEAGIKVQLHTQSEPPFLHELGFGVAPGFQTFVSTQEQRVAYDCLDLLACHTMTVLSRQLHTHHRVHPRSVATLPPPLCPATPPRNGSICPLHCVAEATTCNLCSLSVLLKLANSSDVWTSAAWTSFCLSLYCH